jgi:hypothetical protein
VSQLLASVKIFPFVQHVANPTLVLLVVRRRSIEILDDSSALIANVDDPSILYSNKYLWRRSQKSRQQDS